MLHRHFILAAALILPLTASAQNSEWTPLSGDEIRAALTDTTLLYDTARQTFYASGRTLYDAGRPSWGYWRVEDDRYCSMWPPSDIWACYRIERREAILRFVGERDDITEAQIQKD